MVSLIRFEVHPGNRPGQRRVYARLSTGELRRIKGKREEALLLQYDINEANKGHKIMRYIRINRMKLLFILIAGGAIIVALTVNFPSF